MQLEKPTPSRSHHRSMRVALALFLGWTLAAEAAGRRYDLRVDGLSCPFCAYGIEKRLLRTKGVESVGIDLDKGIVRVRVRNGVRLTEKRLERLVHEAGFTLRSVEEVAE